MVALIGGRRPLLNGPKYQRPKWNPPSTVELRRCWNASDVFSESFRNRTYGLLQYRKYTGEALQLEMAAQSHLMPRSIPKNRSSVCKFWCLWRRLYQTNILAKADRAFAVQICQSRCTEYVAELEAQQAMPAKLPPSCSNGARDGDETDTDCGGSICPRCAAGDVCFQHSDCESTKCNRAGECSQPTDGQKVELRYGQCQVNCEMCAPP